MDAARPRRLAALRGGHQAALPLLRDDVARSREVGGQLLGTSFPSPLLPPRDRHVSDVPEVERFRCHCCHASMHVRFAPRSKPPAAGRLPLEDGQAEALPLAAKRCRLPRIHGAGHSRSSLVCRHRWDVEIGPPPRLAISCAGARCRVATAAGGGVERPRATAAPRSPGARCGRPGPRARPRCHRLPPCGSPLAGLDAPVARDPRAAASRARLDRSPGAGSRSASPRVPGGVSSSRTTTGRGGWACGMAGAAP
jgi:hypothetical protein